MLVVFGITVAIMALFAIGAAVGVIFKRQPLAGSCGGLGALGIERACNCSTPCKSAQQRMKEIEEERAQAQLDAQGEIKFAQTVKDADYSQNREGEGKFIVKK